MFYNNNVESEHFFEKKERLFKKGDLSDAVSKIKAIIERQQNEEIMALYGSGPYKLSKEFRRFEKESVVWHSMTEGDRRKHVERFQSYQPTLEDYFMKPKASGAKPNEQRRKRKPEADMIIDRIYDQSETEEKINDEKEISRPSE